MNCTNRKIRAALLLGVLAAVFPVTVGADSRVGQQTCPMVHIVLERLPGLNIPRNGHSIFFANGELTVAGGHTTNFVPTQTAEYFSDGEWHVMSMAYCHDNGFAVVLHTDIDSVPAGEVIIGGGHSEPLGIGQTFMLERYTSATHSFEGFGCLDRRRVLASGLQLEDGRVIIAGNHYADDDIACFDGRSQVQHVKHVIQGRSNPYILKTAKDNALIIRGNNTRDIPLDTVWADRVEGDAFRVPLLEQWQLLYFDQPFSSDACFIGNEEEGDYSYLLTATDRSGQLAIIQMCDTCEQADTVGCPHFSLLPTACPVPMQSPFGPIFYKGPIVVDRKHQRGYVLGTDSLFSRQYLLAVDYAQRPSQLTLYYTDTLEHATVTVPVVTPDGDLILVGGAQNSNYKPFSDVWRYHFGTDEAIADARQHGFSVPVWLWAVIAVVIAALFYLFRSRRRTAVDAGEPAANVVSDEELVKQICQLIEQDNRYLKSLRQSDIAMELGVSVANISECLNNTRGCTFTQLIAEYRVRHAQKLITDNPELKLAVVIAESGFTSESTFFRIFKAVTGKSPKEWLAERTEK